MTAKSRSHLQDADIVEPIMRFAVQLGFTIIRETIQAPTHIPGIRIEPGMVFRFDQEKAIAPGDLLHEMGHVAILPEPFRSLAKNNVEHSISAALRAWIKTHPFLIERPGQGPIEDPISRALLQSGEQEAIAWSYAAAIAIGIPPQQVFHEPGYGGNASSIAVNLSLKAHPGIHGLQAAGLCQRKSFPKMRVWLQDAHPIALASRNEAVPQPKTAKSPSDAMEQPPASQNPVNLVSKTVDHAGCNQATQRVHKA